MTEILFFLVILFGVFVQALVGFGGTLITMPLGILLMGPDVTKPVMTFVAWITGVAVLITDYRYINWKELGKMIAVMLPCVLAGLWVMGKVQMNFLLIIYGVVIVAIGVKSCFSPPSARRPSRHRMYPWAWPASCRACSSPEGASWRCTRWSGCRKSGNSVPRSTPSGPF